MALNVYVALCYHRLDYYDVSLEILQMYLQEHADSAVAVNLKVRASASLPVSASLARAGCLAVPLSLRA